MISKKQFFIGIGVLTVLLAYFAGAEWSSYRARQVRAELHMLNYLQTGVQLHLDSGGDLPLNWEQFSRLKHWTNALEVCQYNNVPPPSECYIILATPISDPQFSLRKIWLIRARGDKRLSPPGRWALSITNRTIVRIRLDERDVGQEIRSQIESQINKSHSLN